MLESGLHSLLSADSTLSELVGTRIYPVFVPESTAFPCLSYQVVSGSSDVALDDTVVREKRIQFDAWAQTYGVSKQIESALAEILEGYSGTLEDGTTILDCVPSITLDNWEATSHIYRITAEYTLSFV